MKKLLIDGNWVETKSFFAVNNPANGEIIAQVADASREETIAAINAANRALKTWSKQPSSARAKVLRRIEALMLEKIEELARLITLENGKPLNEARGEIAYAASFFGWFAGEAERIYGRVIPASSEQKRLLVLKQPVGVVAAITPWNFPAAMVTRKVAPALAAGCTVVLKPAEQTPLTALALAELMLEAGVPAGVVNVLPTSDPISVGQELLDNVLVSKITFTGSTSVGKFLAEQASKTVKRISLELGGHAPFIVFADADLKAAARGAIQSKFRNSGQTCICANRIYVERNVLEEFLSELKPLVKNLKIGDGLDENTQIGPLIDQAGLQKVQNHVKDAVDHGAKILVGGETIDQRFFAPTLLGDVTPSMLVMHEETFGPVAPVLAFDSETEVINQANAGPFGLAAYVYTRDLSRAWRLSENLQYGIIGLNDALPSTAQAPFGGLKESGLGREGGFEGIEAFLETKYISIGIENEAK